LTYSVHKSIFQKTKKKTKKPKPKQKTIENLVVHDKNSTTFLNSHHHPNLIDAQQGRFTEQWHTT
jgi:hypothetical protein